MPSQAPSRCPSDITFLHLFNVNSDASADRTISDLCHLNALRCERDADCRTTGRICCTVNRHDEDAKKRNNDHAADEKHRQCRLCIYPHF